MLNNVNPAVLNSVMNGMGNMNLQSLLGNSQPPSAGSSEPKVGEVFQVVNNGQLQKLI